MSTNTAPIKNNKWLVLFFYFRLEEHFEKKTTTWKWGEFEDDYWRGKKRVDFAITIQLGMAGWTVKKRQLIHGHLNRSQGTVNIREKEKKNGGLPVPAQTDQEISQKRMIALHIISNLGRQKCFYMLRSRFVIQMTCGVPVKKPGRKSYNLSIRPR